MKRKFIFIPIVTLILFLSIKDTIYTDLSAAIVLSGKNINSDSLCTKYYHRNNLNKLIPDNEPVNHLVDTIDVTDIPQGNPVFSVKVVIEIRDGLSLRIKKF